jgi:uncharacterized protein (TIGR03067 family)
MKVMEGTSLALAGAWVPVAASICGQDLSVGELRVRYLVLDGHDYRIIDRSNQVVDRGEYLIDANARPQAIDICGRTGPHAGRNLLGIFSLDGDRLVVCYDLEEGTERPQQMQAREDQLLLSITYERASGVLA